MRSVHIFKHIKAWAILFPAVISLNACIKTETPPGGAVLTVVHAVPDANSLIMHFDKERPKEWYYTAKVINYATGSYGNQFYAYSGNQHLMLFQLPDTTAHDEPLYSLDLQLPIGSIKSLFLTGTVDHPDTMFIEDHVPYYSDKDSVAGIRFVNLSAGSVPVSINLQGQASGSEVNSLPYKGITEFKRYPANKGDYVFEFRNAATGDLIAVYRTFLLSEPGIEWDPNQWMFKNNTIAFAGTPAAPTTFLINNF